MVAGMSIHSAPAGMGGAGPAAEEPEIKRRADAERNLSRIIEAATTLLAVNPGASMAEIAEASGLVRATLYRHFPTRDHLLMEMYSAALEDALEAILCVDPDRGKVTDAIARVVDALLVVGDRYRILSEERPRSPELIEQEQSVGAPLIALVQRGHRSGEIRDDMPLRWQVAALGSLINEALRAVSREDVERAEAGGLVTQTFLESMRPRRR
jgi:TetR/AcrR family transcriptional regulator, mexCD-oprJ operon repressor